MMAKPADELAALRASVAEADRLAMHPMAFAAHIARAGLWPEGVAVTRSPAGAWLARELGVRAVVVGVKRVTSFDTFGHEHSTPTPAALGEFDRACRLGTYDRLASRVAAEPSGHWEDCPYGCGQTRYTEGLTDPWKYHDLDCTAYAAKGGDDDAA